jgi:hypothetical protein
MRNNISRSGMDTSGSGECPMVRSVEQENELPSSIKA